MDTLLSKKTEHVNVTMTILKNMHRELDVLGAFSQAIVIPCILGKGWRGQGWRSCAALYRSVDWT